LVNAINPDSLSSIEITFSPTSFSDVRKQLATWQKSRAEIILRAYLWIYQTGKSTKILKKRVPSETPGVFSSDNMGYLTHLDYIANRVVW
jgi:hypothetical protein